MSGETCESCRYWLVSADADPAFRVRYRQCRRYPPVIRPSQKRGEWALSEFPLTASGVFCGEWKKGPPQ